MSKRTMPEPRREKGFNELTQAIAEYEALAGGPPSAAAAQAKATLEAAIADLYLTDEEKADVAALARSPMAQAIDAEIAAAAEVLFANPKNPRRWYLLAAYIDAVRAGAEPGNETAAAVWTRYERKPWLPPKDTSADPTLPKPDWWEPDLDHLSNPTRYYGDADPKRAKRALYEQRRRARGLTDEARGRKQARDRARRAAEKPAKLAAYEAEAEALKVREAELWAIFGATKGRPQSTWTDAEWQAKKDLGPVQERLRVVMKSIRALSK